MHSTRRCAREILEGAGKIEAVPEAAKTIALKILEDFVTEGKERDKSKVTTVDETIKAILLTMYSLFFKKGVGRSRGDL